MIKINLLPVKEDKLITEAKGFIAICLISIVVVVILIVSNSSLLTKREAESRERIAEADAEIAKLRTIMGEIQNLKEKKAKLQEKMDMIIRLQEQNIGPVRVLDELSLKIPSNNPRKASQERYDNPRLPHPLRQCHCRDEDLSGQHGAHVRGPRSRGQVLRMLHQLQVLALRRVQGPRFHALLGSGQRHDPHSVRNPQGPCILPPAGAGHSPSRRQREPGAPIDTVRRGTGSLCRQPRFVHPGVSPGFPDGGENNEKTIQNLFIRSALHVGCKLCYGNC